MADGNNDVFAERLRKRLRDLGIDNEKEFAKSHGLKPSSFNRWVRGENQPKVRDFVRVAKAVGCSLDYLAGLSEELQPSHYLIDLDKEDLAVRGKPVPGRTWAWPIPSRFEVVDAVAFEKRESDARKGKGGSK